MENSQVTKYNIEKILKKNYSLEFREFLQNRKIKLKEKKGNR